MTHIAINTFGAHPAGLDAPVRAFMRPGVISVPEDASLRQAQRAMAAHRVHAVLVVGARAGVPLGWVTSRGMLAWLDHDAALTPASAAITEPPVAIEPSASAAEAVGALARTGAGHLLVATEPGRPPEGVVSELDIVRLVAA